MIKKTFGDLKVNDYIFVVFARRLYVERIIKVEGGVMPVIQTDYMKYSHFKLNGYVSRFGGLIVASNILELVKYFLRAGGWRVDEVMIEEALGECGLVAMTRIKLDKFMERLKENNKLLQSEFRLSRPHQTNKIPYQ